MKYFAIRYRFGAEFETTGGFASLESAQATARRLRAKGATIIRFYEYLEAA
jgi:hypothetical protein